MTGAAICPFTRHDRRCYLSFYKAGQALLFVLLQGRTGAAVCPFHKAGQALLFVLLQGMTGAAICSFTRHDRRCYLFFYKA